MVGISVSSTIALSGPTINRLILSQALDSQDSGTTMLLGNGASNI